MDLSISSDVIDYLFNSTMSNTQTKMDTLSGTILGQGIDYFTNGKYDLAIKSFKQAAALSPSSDNSSKAYEYLGQAYVKLGDTDNAIKTYKEAISNYPTSDTFYLALGDIYRGKDDMLDEATQAYEQAVNINPNDAESQYSLGQCYLSAGELNKANEKFNEVVRISPANASGYYGLGQVARAEGDLNGAVSLLTKAQRVDKNFELAYLELGYTYADQGEINKANDQLSVLDANSSDYAINLTSYITQVTQPSINLAYSTNGFNTILGPDTKVAALSSTLKDANQSKLFSMNFTFSKEMDKASIINPYNWKISRATIQANGGVYNGGLTPPTTEAAIHQMPAYVSYNTDTNTATVYFRLYQNATADATIDPKHIVFKFSGVDAYGKAMDTSADEYSGMYKVSDSSFYGIA